ncbi:SLATT domain-containing protein [Amycolatopsis sp. NPDC058986]
MPVEDTALIEAVKRLEARSFKTYSARLKTHERLSRRNTAWNASLVSLATSTTIASVGLLVERNMYGTRGDSLMVALAILSLVASLVVSSVNYGSRARAMEANYKRIQQLSLAAEGFFVSDKPATRQRFLELEKEYGIALESSENHSEADYARSGGRVSKRVTWRDTLITVAPYITLVIPLALLVPFAKWFIDGI